MIVYRSLYGVTCGENRADLLDATAGGADERHGVVSGCGDGNGSDVSVGPRDGGRARDRVGAFDRMIDVVFAAVVVANLQRLTASQQQHTKELRNIRAEQRNQR